MVARGPLFQTFREQITAYKRLFAEGHCLPVIAMLETTDFFEAQIKQCTDLAKRSTKKSDREFWQKMALRWGALLKNRQLDEAAATKTGSNVRAVPHTNIHY
jgi:hypothetical protein